MLARVGPSIRRVHIRGWLPRTCRLPAFALASVLRIGGVVLFTVSPREAHVKYKTTVPNSPDIVASARTGYYYECPDVHTIDTYIIRLKTDVLGPGSNVSDMLKAQAHEDIDRLLEHRLYTQMTAA